MQFLRSLLFTILFFAVSLAYATVLLITAPVPLSVHRRFWFPRTWGKVNLWLLKAIVGLDYVVSGRENLPDEAFISMWKHSSTWETFAQMVEIPTSTWIQKRELLWIPLVGLATLLFKPITINRKAGHSAVNQVVSQGRERLESGLGVTIYPEGTRVAPGQTRKYGISGALLASRTGRLVVPVAHNAGHFWGRRGLLKHPGTVQLVIGPAIDPSGLEPREINQRAQSWIEANVAGMSIEEEKVLKI